MSIKFVQMKTIGSKLTRPHVLIFAISSGSKGDSPKPFDLFLRWAIQGLLLINLTDLKVVLVLVTLTYLHYVVESPVSVLLIYRTVFNTELLPCCLYRSPLESRSKFYFLREKNSCFFVFIKISFTNFNKLCLYKLRLSFHYKIKQPML
jgi:hypothetical protein